MSKIDQILELLKDGDWHNMNEIAEQIKTHSSKLNVAINLLVEYEFIRLDEEQQKVKLCQPVLDFLIKELAC